MYKLEKAHKYKKLRTENRAETNRASHKEMCVGGNCGWGHL